MKKLTKERIDTQRREVQGNPDERFRVLEREISADGRAVAVTLRLETRSVTRKQKRYRYRDAFETYWDHWFTESTHHGPWRAAAHRELALEDVRALDVDLSAPSTDDDGRVTVTFRPEDEFELLEPVRDARAALDVPSHRRDAFEDRWRGEGARVEVRSEGAFWSASPRVFHMRPVLAELAEQIARHRLTRVHVRPRALRSQFPLEEARVTVSGDMPTPEAVVRPHVAFAPWRRYAARILREHDYPGPNGLTRGSYDGSAAFRLVLPGEFRVQVVEEHHYAADRTVRIGKGARSVTVDMARLEDSRKLEVDVDY